MLAFLVCLLSLHLTFAGVIEAPQLLVDFAQNPNSIEWKQISTEHFEIIFPQEVERKAQKVAHLLETAYPLVTRSLEAKPEKISLILQNQSTMSNGFVTLAPRRSEWYVTPAFEPELSNTEWLKTLSVHEFRHVVQFQKSRQGINRVFEVFLGQIGQALGIGLTMPPWFMEGDAVGIETALTKGGRGRLPLFERDLRALLLSGRDYEYDKAHLGSYQDYLPNHYVYGYFYTTFMRNKSGDLFLSNLIDHSTDRSYNPLTFYNTYKRLTGEDFDHFYRSVLKELVQSWQEKISKLTLTPYEVKNLSKKKDWINYLYPQAIGRGKFLALKKGLSHIPQFVITDGKYEKTILYPSPLLNEYPFKLRNGRLAFTEFEIDSRWGYRDFSRIKVFDLKKKRFIFDLRQTKARLAVLDHSGEYLLYVSWDEKQNQEIIVSQLDGKVVYRLPYDPDKVITSLDWISSQEIVMVTKDQDDQKEVVKLSLMDHIETTLYSKTLTNLGYVTTHQGRILIESPQSGIDNVFELVNGQMIQLTSSRFGAYAPTVSFDELIYNDYSAEGMNVAGKKLPWDEKQESADSFVPFYEKISSFETQGMDKDYFNQEKFPVSNYKQVKNAFNMHSWIILAPPLSSSVTLIGLSRDLLNKQTLSFGGSYDLNEKVADGFVAAAWSNFYPVFDLRAGYGSRHQTFQLSNGKFDDHWEEGTFEGGLQLPWKRLSGRFVHNLVFRGFAKLIKVTGLNGSNQTIVSDGALLSPGADLQYSYLSRLAHRDINPPLGVALTAHFEQGKDITGVKQKGSLESADGRLYLPGLKHHHSFFHQIAYERQRDQSYQYKSFILKPRGTQNVFLDEARKFSANYLFPVAYPDFRLSRYAYFKRLAMNLFYDDMKGRFQGQDYFAATTGWELLVETNFLRIFFPVTIGVRGNYIIKGQESNNYEIFVNTFGSVF